MSLFPLETDSARPAQAERGMEHEGDSRVHFSEVSEPWSRSRHVAVLQALNAVEKVRWLTDCSCGSLRLCFVCSVCVWLTCVCVCLLLR